MPLSEKKKAHLERLRNLPQVKAGRFQKGRKPWNYGTKVMLDRDCEFCGGHFQIAQSQLSRIAHRSGRFCSKECFYKAKRKYGRTSQAQKLYEEGKTYKEIASEMGILPATVASIIYRAKIADRYGDGIFNSATRQRVKQLLRDKYGIRECELCGYNRATDLAHIIEKKNGGEYLLSNCLLLCPNCHHLFDYNMLTDIEKNKLRRIARLSSNLQGRLK